MGAPVRRTSILLSPRPPWRLQPLCDFLTRVSCEGQMPTSAQARAAQESAAVHGRAALGTGPGAGCEQGRGCRCTVWLRRLLVSNMARPKSKLGGFVVLLHVRRQVVATTFSGATRRVQRPRPRHGLHAAAPSGNSCWRSTAAARLKEAATGWGVAEGWRSCMLVPEAGRQLKRLHRRGQPQPSNFTTRPAPIPPMREHCRASRRGTSKHFNRACQNLRLQRQRPA